VGEAKNSDELHAAKKSKAQMTKAHWLGVTNVFETGQWWWRCGDTSLLYLLGR